MIQHLKTIKKIYNFYELTTDRIISHISTYNNTEYKRFYEKEALEEKKFISNLNPNKKNGVTYEMPFFMDSKFGGVTRPEIYREYRCVEYKADLIDFDMVPEYESILNQTGDAVLNILDYYLQLDEDGKLATQEEESSSPKNKIRAKATVEELVFVFRILNEVGLFDATNEDLSHLISENFTTKRASKQISVNNLINLFSKSDKKSIDFMTRLLIKIEAGIKKLK